MSIQSVGSTGVAMAKSKGVAAVVSAMGGNSKHVTATPVIENRRHIHPEDVFESRKTIHPTPRFEARQVFKFDPTDTMKMQLGKQKAAHGLPFQNKANDTQHAAANHVRRYVKQSTGATILDMFI